MTNAEKTNMIFGRAHTVKEAGRKHIFQSTLGRSRIIVDGVNHKGGSPIRFKSIAKAENHIKNMGLSLI